MNPNMPYDSNALKNMVSRVKTYCSHIIPLVFDNTLSYYETLCAFCGKLNELCDAVNAQNLTITEFTHMVEVEITKFEEYMEGELTTLKEDMEDAKSDITNILNELSNDIRPALAELEETVNSLQSDLSEKVGWNDVVYSVLENNDHPVTSGAVYDAIQQGGGGGGGFVPDATTTSKGIVQVGDNINVSGGVISVRNASHLNKGVVTADAQTSGITFNNGAMMIQTEDPLYINSQNNKVGVVLGDNITTDTNGALTVPEGSNNSKGVFQAGSNLTASNGVINVATALPDVKGVVTIDSTDSNLTLGQGILDVKTGSKSQKGVLKVGTNLSVSDGVVDVPTAQAGTTKGVVTIDNTATTLNPFTLTSGVLGLNVGDRLEVVNSTLNAKKATASSLGVVAPAITGCISVGTSGDIDVDNATTVKKGAVTLTNTITSGDTTHVPTADAVYNAISGTTPPQIADATTTSKGIMQVGNNLTVSNGVVSVPVGSNSQMGVVTAGTNTSIVNGEVRVADASTSNKGVVQTATTIDSTSTNFTVPTTATVYNALQNIVLPDATTSTKGVIKYSDNFNINSNGQLAISTGANITTDVNGNITVPTATTATKGVVSVGNNITLANGEISVPLGGSQDPTTYQTLAGVVKPATNSTIQFDANGGITCNNALPATVNGSNYGSVKVVDTLSSGSTAVPTAGAVYSAIQGAGSGTFIVPKPAGEASTSDDFYIGNEYGSLFTKYEILNSNVIHMYDSTSQSGGNSNIYLFFKNSVYNINTVADLLSHIEFITLPIPYSNNSSFIFGNNIITNISNYTGFYFVSFIAGTNITYNYGTSYFQLKLK